MTLFYRLLGPVALVNYHLSRHRLYFLPLNWALLGISLLWMLVSLTGLRDSYNNNSTPRRVTVAQLAADPDPRQNYVSITGQVHPDEMITAMQTRRGHTVGRYFVPLTDNTSAAAVMVESYTPDIELTKTGTQTITGMVKYVLSDYRKQVAARRTGGRAMNIKYAIMLGAKPASHTIAILNTALPSLILLLLAVATALGNVVFQTAATAYRGLSTAFETPAAPAMPSRLRATGTFVSQASKRRRFFNIPASVQRGEAGQLLLVSKIDTSSTLLGFKVDSQIGQWAIVMPGQLEQIERGVLYVGLGVSPAIRVRYRDAKTGRRETAVLALASESERDSLVAALNEQRGAAAPFAAAT